MTASRTAAAAAAEPDAACTEAAAHLEALARRLLPPGVAVAALDPRLVRGGLLPEEEPAVAAAVPRRRAELTAGRVAARRAMAELGLPPRPVPAGPDRAPVWPEGLVGSISHTAEACIAVVVPAHSLSGIGIDLEPDEDLPGMLWETVLTPPERRWLATRQPQAQGRIAKLIFSAKEATYKCQYPLTRTLFGFDGLSIELGPADRRFTARFTQDLGAFRVGDTLTGALGCGAGHILACATIRA